MLVINQCGYSKSAHESMKKRIAALLKSGKRSYLIVPEQQTVTAEAEMARELPESAPLYFEVTNFTRLADSIFRSLGGIAKEHIDAAKGALIMWRTLTELSPTLDMTHGRFDISDGLVRKALLALKELDAAAVDTDTLSALTEEKELGNRLKRKIEDITSIRSLYTELISEKYGAAEDAVLRSAKLLCENPEHFSGAVFFVEGFSSFTEGQHKVLSALMKNSELTVFLPIPSLDATGFEYTELLKTKSKITDIAKRSGVEIRLAKDSAYCGERPELLEQVLRLIWRTDGKIDNDSLQNTDILRVFEAHTPFDECDFVAQDIRRRVMEGSSYSDFALILRSPDEYLGVLDVALEKSDIPYFMSRTHEISQNEAIKFMYSAYAAAGKFRREDVVSYMKCGFCDAGREECDEFELYIERWAVSGARLCDSAPLNMNPDGYTTRSREGVSEELLRINETKNKIILPLVEFSKKIRGTRTVREHAEILYDFLVTMNIEEKLKRRGDESAELWRIIAESLDTLVLALGDMDVCAEVFLSQLKILFSSVEIGRIPSVIDEVTVGGAELIRLSEKKHIYMLGVNQGKFPKNQKDESFFTERDKAVLSLHDIKVEPDLELRCARELFFFSRAISFAKETLTILYSQSSTDFKPIARTDVIDRLSTITDGKIQPVKIAELAPEKRIFTPASAKELSQGFSGEARRAVDKALIAVGVKPYPTDEVDIDNGSLSLGEEGRALVYTDNINLTQTRIDTYVKCPLNFFCKYNLSLDDAKPYEISYAGIGSYIHAILENFFSYTEKNGVELSSLTNEEREKITFRASEKYLAELSGEKEAPAETKLLLSRLYRAALPVVEDICDELSSSDFSPKFFELNLDTATDGTPEPISLTYPDGRVTVYGQIDRVDTFKSGNDVYVRVVDYKTGTKRFSPDDIEKGENLQMFLYLKSLVESKNQRFIERIGLENGGRLIPAGLVYVKTSLGDVKASHDNEDEIISLVKKNQARQGMILNDPISIAAQNPEYLPVKYKKDGSPTAYSEKYLYTLEGWDTLMKTVEDVIGNISSKMRSGDVHAFAKGHKGEKLPCEYCEYKAFCRKSSYAK